MAYLNGKHVDNDIIDPKKHIFIGKFRTPSFGDFMKRFEGKLTGILICNCGRNLDNHDSIYEHWNEGHFDELVYKDIISKEE